MAQGRLGEGGRAGRRGVFPTSAVHTGTGGGCARGYLAFLTSAISSALFLNTGTRDRPVTPELRDNLPTPEGGPWAPPSWLVPHIIGISGKPTCHFLLFFVSLPKVRACVLFPMSRCFVPACFQHVQASTLCVLGDPGLSWDQDHWAPCLLAPVPAHPPTLNAEQKHGLQTAIRSIKPLPWVHSAQPLVPSTSCLSHHGLHDPTEPHLGTRLGIRV